MSAEAPEETREGVSAGASPVEGDPTPVATPASEKAPPPAPKAKKKRSRLRKVALGMLLAFPVGVLGLWIAIHKIDWLGPWLADAGRAVFGNAAIAKLEDWAYGLQDRYNQIVRADEPPKAHWAIPDMPPSLREENADKIRYPRFVPSDVGPMISERAAPGDGQWVPMVDPHEPDEPPPMWKTLLHPDKKRGWALVAVVAVDLRQVRLHLVPGTYEPTSTLKQAKDHPRPGRIAEEDLDRTIAAFNGGFKTTHGNYGMKADGVVFVEARNSACTIAGYDHDVLKIGPWEDLEPSRDEMQWFRQAPMCMYTEGVMHKGLLAEENTLWGATLDKDTVIRRSAIGISKDNQTLYVGISEATTAAAIANAMSFAGAYNVAQLDVNFSYPKFVTVELSEKGPTVKTIIDGFDTKADDYVRRPNPRDFFYLTRKAPEEKAPVARTAPP